MNCPDCNDRIVSIYVSHKNKYVPLKIYKYCRKCEKVFEIGDIDLLSKSSKSSKSLKGFFNKIFSIR